ncbi:MAG: AAA family ATPase [Cyanobacteria bacterium J06623_4]
MGHSSAQSEIIKNHLLTALQQVDPNAKVHTKTSSLGWFWMTVTTRLFAGKTLEDREQYVDNILADLQLDLGQYPISNYELLLPEEHSSLIQDAFQLPLWSDMLLAPDADHVADIETDSEPALPSVVTFYSFKGGVGRSTALGMVAIALANRNRRVVMIDFDLEAPGISVLFQNGLPENSGTKYGVLDYLHQRSLTPDANVPPIESCILQVDLASRGELFLVPVGEYNENYIHRLAEFDRDLLQSFYRGDRNPVKDLIADIKSALEPDVILIDARPGFSDTSAVALFDLADTGVICFTPTEQSFEGLKYVVQAIRKQSEQKGKPDLRFLLTPMPVISEAQSRSWIGSVEDWIAENWGLPNDSSIGELYFSVFYNPNIVALSDLTRVPNSLLADYSAITDAIDASLPNVGIDRIHSIPDAEHSVLDELNFQSARAQDLAVDKISDVFQRTEDFPKFISKRTWLIRGAKGTGKSILFRLFVEQSKTAKKIAKDTLHLQNFSFVAGHGEPKPERPTINSNTLESYEKTVGEESWSAFWMNYGLLQLCYAYKGLLELSEIDDALSKLAGLDRFSQTEICEWLVHRASTPSLLPKAFDELAAVDRWLEERGLRAWLLYDELDAGFGFGEANYLRRQRALNALLGWWLESGISLKRITPKIFLREDIWSQLNFTNKGHYVSRFLQLRWEEVDLWRLVQRQILHSSKTLRDSTEREFGITIERLDTIPLDLLRKSLFPLWGERMGRGRKAYTYNWVRTRIADSNDNCFPRSLILLLQESVEWEKSFSTPYSSPVVLRPRALINAFPSVSKQRVDEVRNEYPELKEYLGSLNGERSPIEEPRLSEVWKLDSAQTAKVIKEMIEAGILKERSKPKDAPPRVFAVTELYLYGLDMRRKGQR